MKNIYIYFFMRSADWVLAMYVFDSVYMDNYMIRKLTLYDAKKNKKKTNHLIRPLESCKDYKLDKETIQKILK